MDPLTVPIQGDLSRQDAVVLAELCQNKKVIEFGVGGSTLLIARVAKALESFDTDLGWLDRTRRRLDKLKPELTCLPQLRHTSGVPETIDDCDVLFIDGRGDDRFKWLKFFPKCQTLICHDSLGDTGGNGPTLYHVMAELFRDRASLEYLDHASFHHQGSNMVVVHRRREPIRYQNWNLTELENRLDPYAPD